MKIVGFPVDVSRSQDGRIVRGLRTRQALIQATLDLIQAGDVEPTSAAIATIAGVSSRALFQHFHQPRRSLRRGLRSCGEPRLRPHASGRQRRRRCPAASTCWSRIARSCSRNGCRLALRRARALRRAGRRPRRHPAAQAPARASCRLVRHRARQSRPESRDLVLDSLDLAFGLDSWMNMREQLRLSPVHASRTWRFTAEAIVLQALTVPIQPAAA